MQYIDIINPEIVFVKKDDKFILASKKELAKLFERHSDLVWGLVDKKGMHFGIGKDFKAGKELAGIVGEHICDIICQTNIKSNKNIYFGYKKSRQAGKVNTGKKYSTISQLVDETCQANYIMQVDEEDNIIGMRDIKDFSNSDLIHRSVHLILLNDRDEMLICRRAKTKRWYPDLYSYSVSGTVEDEPYFEAMQREMKEEIGLELPFARLFKYKYFDKKADNAWRVVYISRSNKKPKIDKKEVDEYQWIGLDELANELKNNPTKYTPPFLAGMKLFFEKSK